MLQHHERKHCRVVAGYNVMIRFSSEVLFCCRIKEQGREQGLAAAPAGVGWRAHPSLGCRRAGERTDVLLSHRSLGACLKL
jgi:hypothetical protein